MTEDSFIGQRFNFWTVIARSNDRVDSSGKHHKRYVVQCDCGATIDKDLYKIKHGAKMCKNCYLKILPDNGIPFEKKYNKYDLSGEYGIGFTYNTNREFYFDLDDYDKIKDYCWFEVNRGYIETNISCGNTIMMHQLILGKNTDHVNRKTNDNRKSNLRICSQKENTRNRTVGNNNSSGFIGVCFDKKSNKWVSYITCDGNRQILGWFVNKDEAIVTRLKSEKELFGEFAPQRHLFEEYNI